MSATLALSPWTGRPLPKNSIIAAARIAAAPPARAARSEAADVPPDLRQIIRPQAAYHWMLPQLASVTPTYIESILRGAFAGSHIQQWELFDLMEDTWPRLPKNLNELKRAVIAMDWQLQPWAEEDAPPTASAKERARLVSSALWRMRPDPCRDENEFEGTLYDLLDAWGKGTSVLEILWHIRSAGQLGDVTAPRATVWLRPDTYAWSEDGCLGLNPNSLEGAPRPSSGRGYLSSPSYYTRPEDLVEIQPDKFLIAISKAKSGHPLTSALLRPLAWWWCAANFSADWLMNLAQIFGLPFRWATYESGASEATISKICSMLENMGSAAWAAFPAGTTMDFKEASKTGDNSPQADLLDRADKNCDLLILGQTLTSDTGGSGQGGGSLALGKVHAGVKQENVEAAACFAARIINGQLIPAILRLNYGDEEEPPEFKPQPRESGEEGQSKLKATTESYGVAVRAGLVTPNEDDEEHFRKLANLPAMSPQVKKAWKLNPTREPITNQDEGGLPSPFGRKPGGPPQAPAENPEPGTRNPKPEKSEAGVSAKSAPPGAALLNPAADTLARALASDLEPALDRLNRVLQIQDPEIFRARLADFKTDLERLKADLTADPKTASVLETILSTALARGMRRET